MHRLLLRFYCKCEIALPDDDFVSLDLNCLGTQISGKAVFFSPQMHNTDDSSEMKPSDRNVRNRKHQRTVRKTALGPHVFAGKGISPVAFDIAEGIREHIGRAIDNKLPIY